MTEPSTVEINLAQGLVFGENNMVLQQFYAAPTETPKPVAPFLPTGFLGRDEALAELDERLGRNRNKAVLAIWGVAGVGKSALASALALSKDNCFPDGCLWCDMRQARGDGRVALETVALAVGQDPRLFPEQSLNQRVRSVLSSRRTLVVLDNVANSSEIEHLVALANPENTQVLLTTRSRQVAMEMADEAFELTPLSVEFSRRLLRQVSNLLEDTPLERLVEGTGGIPLLIQAVARQIRRARPQRRADLASELAARLMIPEYRLGLLEGDVPYRDVLLLNYESLGLTAKRVMKLMGVLGSHTVDVAMVQKILDLDEEETGEATEALVDLALAVEHQTVRLRLPDDVHELARELAEDAGEGRSLRSKAADYLKDWLEQEAGSIDTQDQLARVEHYLVLIEDCVASGHWGELQRLTGLSKRPIQVTGQLTLIYNTRWPLAAINVSLGNRCYLDKVDWVGMEGGDLIVKDAWIREWRLAGASFGDLVAKGSTLSRIDMRGTRARDLIFHTCNLETLDLRGAQFRDLIIRASRATKIMLDQARCRDVLIRDCVLSECDFTKARFRQVSVTGEFFLIDCRLEQDDPEAVE